MSIEDAYNTWSGTYDTTENRTRDLDQRVTRSLLADERCRVVLEIGCGTGKNTSFLAGIGEQVLALDFSEGMLARARVKVDQPNVTFQRADITQPWPCKTGEVNLIVCNLVLEHIEDLSFIFQEASRVLARAGRLFICELHPYRQYQGRKATFQQDQQTVEIPAFVHHISEFLEWSDAHGLRLNLLKEWWHEEDHDSPPRLVSFMFEKQR